MKRMWCLIGFSVLTCTGCTTIAFQSLRTVFPAATKVEAKCTEYSESVDDIGNAIAGEAAHGWRVMSMGSRVTTVLVVFSSSAVAVCYEREASSVRSSGLAPQDIPPATVTGARQPTPPPAIPSRTQQDIEKAIRAQARTLSGCITRARGDGSLPAGPITFELNLTVNANGTVDEPALAGPESVLATPLAVCFAQAMINWDFPAGDRDTPVRKFQLPVNVR